MMRWKEFERHVEKEMRQPGYDARLARELTRDEWPEELWETADEPADGILAGKPSKRGGC